MVTDFVCYTEFVIAWVETSVWCKQWFWNYRKFIQSLMQEGLFRNDLFLQAQILRSSFMLTCFLFTVTVVSLLLLTNVGNCTLFNVSHIDLSPFNLSLFLPLSALCMCSQYPTLVFRKKWSNNRNSAYYRRDKLKTQILKPTASCFSSIVRSLIRA